jgi:hypothetical protein
VPGDFRGIPKLLNKMCEDEKNQKIAPLNKKSSVVFAIF